MKILHISIKRLASLSRGPTTRILLSSGSVLTSAVSQAPISLLNLTGLSVQNCVKEATTMNKEMHDIRWDPRELLLSK